MLDFPVRPVRSQLQEADAFPVISPDFVDTKRGVNPQAVCWMMGVHFHRQVGRWVPAKVDVETGTHERLVLNVEALVGFQPFLEALAFPSRRTERRNVDVTF